MSVLLSIVLIIIGAGIMFISGYFFSVKIREKKIVSVKELASNIIEKAKREAETIKRSATVESEKLMSRLKSDFEKSTRNTIKEFQQRERRLADKDMGIEKKSNFFHKKEQDLQRREREISQKERAVKAKEERYTRLIGEENRKLEEISGMTKSEAKELLLVNLKDQVKYESAQMIREIKEKAKTEADKEAKEIIASAIQKCSTDHVTETTVTVVSLPNNDMKGRIIGREGRNIRAFENATGIEVIIDDTPEAVILSGFSPIRREVARIALERLIVDGRIHPARIEEVVAKAQKDVEEMMLRAGEDTVLEVGIPGIHPELIKLLGRLKYRTSYGQNVLQHSKEVAYLAGLMAGELDLDINDAKRAGLLHDIGKAVDQKYEGTHALIGAEICKKFGENPVVVNAIAAHHEEVEAISPIAVLIQSADAISGSRPGARRETLEAYIKRLEKLEQIASSYDGVGKVYAMQAGREIRVIVEPDKVSDAEIEEIADEVARQIEKELQYPGQIKVIVIREIRASEYAK